MNMHPSIQPDGIAVVTGGAAGIGYAIGKRLAREGMRVIIFDKDAHALGQAVETIHLRVPGCRLSAVCGDVTKSDSLQRLKQHCTQMGPVNLLVNNAAILEKAGPWEHEDIWQRVMNVNLWSVLQLQRMFVGRMLSNGSPGAIVNVGSKEGITTPPGSAAYAVSKAALRVLTEQLAHELRERSDQVTAHLLIPGFTFTPMNFPEMSQATPKPAEPWTADQVANRMVDGMAKGDFYIFCEDNEVTREVDQLRMQWSMDDLILNRPALSRWHPQYREKFLTYLENGKSQ